MPPEGEGCHDQDDDRNVKVGEPHQRKGQEDQENVKDSLDGFLTRFKDHAGHQAAGCCGHAHQDRAGVLRPTGMEVKEPQGAGRDEGRYKEAEERDGGSQRTLEMIADVDCESRHIGSGQELDEAQAREEFLIGEPAFLRDHESPDIGGDTSSEARESDEKEESGQFSHAGDDGFGGFGIGIHACRAAASFAACFSRSLAIPSSLRSIRLDCSQSLSKTSTSLSTRSRSSNLMPSSRRSLKHFG